MLVSRYDSTINFKSNDYLLDALSKLLATQHKTSVATVTKIDEFVYVFRVTYLINNKKYSRFISRKQVILATRLYQLWLNGRKINKKSNSSFPVNRCLGNVSSKLPIYGIVNYANKLSWVYAYKRYAVVVIGNKMYTTSIKFETVFAIDFIKYEFFN